MENYDKIAVVGRGAFGTVYLCRRVDGHRVILKKISIRDMNQQELQVTEREVKIISSLKHPHIIQYYDSFMDGGNLIIVMEYATKGTLADYLEGCNGQLLTEKKILYLLAQLCMAVGYIHNKDILHRDITTKNILLSGCYGHIVKVGDFGISKILSSHTKALSIVGTPYYLSPELCEGRPYGTHTDVWALGCVLYNMCTLKQAFYAPNLASLVMKIMHGYVEPLDTKKFSSQLINVVESMLEKDPLSRSSMKMLMAHPLLTAVICKLQTDMGSIYDINNNVHDMFH